MQVDARATRVTEDLLRDPKKINFFYCKDKEGRLVALESEKEFNAKVHVRLAKDGAVVSPGVEPPVKPLQDELTKDKLRFAELAIKGRLTLKGEEREEYDNLKKKLQDEPV